MRVKKSLVGGRQDSVHRSDRLGGGEESVPSMHMIDVGRPRARNHGPIYVERTFCFCDGTLMKFLYRCVGVHI